MWLFHVESGEVAWHQPQNVEMKKLMVFIPKNEHTFYVKFWDQADTKCVMDSVSKPDLKF
jgi:hypothetical protein